MQAGDGTYHPGSDGHGSCEFGPTPNDLMIAAINRDLNGGVSICGAFARVTGPKGSVVVRIVDSCPECKQGDLDFSVEAFARIATAPPGRVPITWEVVAGDVEGPIRLRYREEVSRSWVAIQVRNHRLPISTLEVLPTGETTWRQVPRQSWNYFVVNGRVPAGPLRVRVTAFDGQTLEEWLPDPQGQGGLEFKGLGQFR